MLLIIFFVFIQIDFFLVLFVDVDFEVVVVFEQEFDCQCSIFEMIVSENFVL